MRWHTIQLVGLAALVVSFSVGCGSDSKKDAGVGSMADGDSTGGATGGGGTIRADGSIDTGGSLAAGGAAGAGAAPGTGGRPGAGGVPGTGGVTGAGGGVVKDGSPVGDGANAPFDVMSDGAASIDRAASDLRDTAGTSLDHGAAPEVLGADTVIDKPQTTPPACAAVGGFCTARRWDSCPAHYEPVAPDGKLDCNGEGQSGFCCVPAPASECSESGSGNCLPESLCTDCWYQSPTPPACEGGRVCCVYICD